MDTSYVEMFTNELFTDDDNNTVTLAEESHSLNTPPMVNLVDDLVDLSEDEQQHVVVDLSGDPKSTQEVLQVLHLAPHLHLHRHLQSPRNLKSR